jgi:hypothetical protein
MIQETIKMMKGYLSTDWEQLKGELKDTFRHADSRVYMYRRSYLERLCMDQRDRGNFCLKAFILAYDNMSRIMIDKGALAEYSQVEMLLGAVSRNLRATAVMKLQQDPRDPSTFKYDKLRKHVRDNCATANALARLDWDGARKAPGVSAYPIPAGVPLPQMPVVINFPAITCEETPAPAPAMEEIPIVRADNTIDTKMINMMTVFEAWTFQMSNANEPGYVG